MRLLHLNLAQIISMIIILSGIQVLETKKPKKQICPIGFKLAYNRYKGDFVCYKRKELEAFTDVLNDCDGNLYTSKLYRSLNISKLDYSNTLWSEYKSFYPGGPFVSWSRNEGEWSVIDEVDAYEPTSLQDDLDQNLCLVINKFGNYTAVQCDRQFYRYCLVRPYSDRDEMTKKGCEELRGSWRFVNSKEICLLGVTGVGGGTVRATWNQSQALCGRHGGTLLSRGWQYANMPLFHISGVSTSPIYPLGMIWDYDTRKLRYVSEDNIVEEPFELFGSTFNSTNETVYMAIQDEAWKPVNSSYIFFDVICEHEVPPRNISIKLRINSENKMILDVKGSVDKDDIHCTTDSESYKPTKVRIHHDDDNDIYILSPVTDGYYWCTHIDRYNYQKTESGVVLFTRERSSLVNLYTVKIRLMQKYNFDEVNDLKDDWQDKLEEYIFYRTKYVQIVDDYKILNPDEAENLLKEFKSSLKDLSWRSGDVIYKITIKRLYMDKQTVLLHVELNPEMIPVTPGTWGDIEVKFMKPAYYCKGFDSVPRQAIGESTFTQGCRTYTCVGDFNQGVQWIETETPGCTLTTSLPINSIMTISDVTYRMPTPDITEPIMSTRAQQYMRSPTTENSDEDTNSDEINSNRDSSSSELNDITESTTDISSTEIFTTELSTTVSVSETEAATTNDTMTTNSDKVVPAMKPPLPIIPPTRPPTVTPIEIIPTMTITSTPVLTTTTKKPLAPEEQLDQVLIELEHLLQNDTITLTVDKVDNTFDQLNEILDVDDDLNIPGNLLSMLDSLGARINLNGSATGATIRGNIALLVADAAPENPVRGVLLTAGDQNVDTFTNNSFEFIDTLNSSQLSANKSAAVVYLPESVTTTLHRISFVVFRNERAFRPQDGVFVNSRIVSVNVENVTQFSDGEVIDIHLAPVVEDLDRNVSRACAYWHFLQNDTGYWSQEGCIFIKSTVPGTLDTCRCDHLTHFAEILVPRTVFSEKNERVLEILSIIGCCLSLLGLGLIIITALLFRMWRREFSNKIWLQLCIALIILVVCFLVIALAKFDGYDVPCMLIGVALHYSVLASFCWMLVAAIISYRRLVLVFTREISHKLLRASAFSWGAPFAIVGVLLSVDPHSYEGRFEEKTPSGSFCYPSGLGLWLAVYAPIAAMLLANWALFILIVRSVFASRRIQRHGDTNEALRCACVSCLLVFLFGLPWVFGLFASNIVAAYFFTCTATFQGFVLFTFIVLGNKKTRDLWLNKLKIKRIQKVPVTSSTYTNRSVGGGTRPERSLTTMEAKNLKPRSLSSQDDSRFS